MNKYKNNINMYLHNDILGEILLNIENLQDKINFCKINKEFYKINGLKIIAIQRRSKYLLINLNKDITILVHLGMTGKFFITDNKKRYKTSFYYSLKKNDKKHDHLTLFFNKKIKLIYNDVRKFGFIKIFSSKDVFNCKHLFSLGPEPLSNNFNLKR